ncbi:hypothetical protein KKP97_06425 [Methanothermococcus sp. SCGC AD-155-C09]|nr:hypothetical protein [Methanothermococcus sp. SCGC AD-155-C09]
MQRKSFKYGPTLFIISLKYYVFYYNIRIKTNKGIYRTIKHLTKYKTLKKEYISIKTDKGTIGAFKKILLHKTPHGGRNI